MFFLGAYAGLDPTLTGATFYDELARQIGYPRPAGDRTAVAAWISNRFGTKRLRQEIRAPFQRARGPSVIHRLIAALPELLRRRGAAAPIWVMTTNYDTFVERSLADMDERFHLLYYASDYEPGQSSFFERRVDGIARRIVRPDYLLQLDGPSTVVVKLNGGLAFYPEIPECYAVERAHFEALAAGIPHVLPRYLRTALRARSMLFLGHGLVEPDTRAIIRYAAGEDRTLKSWAVQLRPADTSQQESWDLQTQDMGRLGVMMLDDDLERFVLALYRELLSAA